jgi:hypothetical protein
VALLTGTVTPTSFATALLSYLGLPTNAGNVAAVIAWEKAEGGNWSNGATYNPLNTTLKQAGSYAMNSAGVQAYTSWDQGLAATAQTLEQSNMTPIRQALATGGGCQGLADALAQAPWGTNGKTVAKLCGVAYDPGSTSASSSTDTTACAIGNFLGGCLINVGQLNAIVGGLKIGGGAVIMGAGLLLAISAALGGTRAGRAAQQAAQRAPVVGTVARTTRTRQATQRAAQEQRAGQQRETQAYTRERRTQQLRTGDERLRQAQERSLYQQDTVDFREAQAEERAEARRNRITPQEKRERGITRPRAGGIPNPRYYAYGD